MRYFRAKVQGPLQKCLKVFIWPISKEVQFDDTRHEVVFFSPMHVVAWPIQREDSHAEFQK